ncbi:hypothetical protein SEA_TARYNEARAL_56 [Mycobacterium phage Tarynearal]|nr:hypothetical protein SEA_TARYNEARAL_56 [Mycobacterium phage Tarynearal]
MPANRNLKQDLVASCGCHLIIKFAPEDPTRVVDVIHGWACFSHGAPRGGYL